MRSPTIAQVAFAAVTVFAAWPRAAQAQDHPKWVVSGTVTYDSKPLKNGYVYAQGPGRVKDVRTDAQGHFSLEGDAPGFYQVRTVKDWEDSHEYAVRSLTLAAGSRMTVDLTIPKGGVLSGRVLDRNRQPIPKAIVSAYVKSEEPTGLHLQPVGEDQTNDLGEYRIAHLPEHAYLLVVDGKPLKVQKVGSNAASAPGLDYPLRAFYPDTPLLDSAVEVDLRWGQEVSSLNIVLEKQPSHCIAFQVADSPSTDAGTKGAAIGVGLEQWSGRAVLGMEKGFEGELAVREPLRICGLVNGEYRLRFMKSLVGDRKFQLFGYTSISAMVKERNVDLGSLELLPPVELKGRLSVKGAAEGASVPPGIQVGLLATQAFDLRVGRGMTAQVQSDGGFRVPAVFADDYAVRVSGLPAGYYVQEAKQNGRNVRQGGLSAANGDIEIVLGSDGPIVSGRVLAGNGAGDDAPVPDATVFLVSEELGIVLSTRSDQAGNYRFAIGVQPGEYKIAAAANVPEGLEQDKGTASRCVAKGTDVKLNSQDRRAIDLPGH
jgi:hypothetical protein